jgi:pimeloyl-ACP methyl ester carboxylesterase
MSGNAMESKQMMMQTGRVTTEGDALYYEVRGQGPPLLMIPGGSGDAAWYSRVADILADEYKVITYDRRANGRSTTAKPQNFEISQQSRDAVAVLGAADEESAFVFGNSSGAIIALDMATTQPRAVRAVIAHEPPVARVHPQARKWQRFFAGVYWLACWFGATPAALRFAVGVGLPIQELARAAREAETHQKAVGVGLPLQDFARAAREAEAHRKKDSEPRVSSQEASEILIKHELLPITNYLPDITLLKKNGVRVFMAAGKGSLAKKRFYAQTAPILAKKLDCAMVLFPGHHISYFDMPEEWAATLRRVLHKAAEAQQ